MTGRASPQMKIRLPIELKAQIESAAVAEARSLNAEIVHRLQGSFATSEQAEGGTRVVLLSGEGRPTAAFREVIEQAVEVAVRRALAGSSRVVEMAGEGRPVRHRAKPETAKAGE